MTKDNEPVAWLCECDPAEWDELNSDERSVVVSNKDSLRNYVESGYSITPFYAAPPDLAAKVVELEAQRDELMAALVAVTKSKAIFNMYPSRNKSRSYGAVVADAIAKGEK